MFPRPLKTENLGAKGGQPFDACPYCLTEIVVEASTLGGEGQKSDNEKTDENQTIQQSIDEKSVRSPTPRNECSHFFGYLSKRSSKDKIPEECMVCGKVVNCMLKDVTG